MQGMSSPEAAGLTGTDRLIALTDGLFATALTVLILAFHLPEIDNPALNVTTAIFFRDIVALTPSLLSYVLTFLVAGSYWLAHHRAFEVIPRTDRRLQWFNLMFLLCVGLLPFSTQLVGVRGNAISWSVYCMNMVLVGAAFALEWVYAVTHGLVIAEVKSSWVKNITVRNLITPGVFLASLVVSLANHFRPAVFFPAFIPVVRAVLNRFYPLEVPVLEKAGLFSRKKVTEWLWNLAVFFPIILFALWVYWISSYYRSP